MKKRILLILSIAVLFSMSACSNASRQQMDNIETQIAVQKQDATQNKDYFVESTSPAEQITSGQISETDIAEEATENMEMTQKLIYIVIGEQKIPVTLYDTPTANALYDALPMNLTFEDFNSVEKISYLKYTLPTDGEPDGCNPTVGDFCLYAPWGNLSIFYQDFRYSDSLILLGHIDSGMDIISAMKDNTTAILKKVEN